MSKNDTKLRRSWRERGRCTGCGRHRDSERLMCQRCLGAKRDESHRRRFARTEAGLCTECGRQPARDDAQTCVSCYEARREYDRQRRAPRDKKDPRTAVLKNAIVRAAAEIRDAVRTVEYARQPKEAIAIRRRAERATVQMFRSLDQLEQIHRSA